MPKVRSQRYWKICEEAALYELVMKGVHPHYIAMRLRRSREAIMRKRKEMGIGLHDLSRKRLGGKKVRELPPVWTYERDLALEDGWRAGYSPVEIAEELGLEPSVVDMRRKILGLSEKGRDRQWQQVEVEYVRDCGAYEDLRAMARHLRRSEKIVEAKILEVLPERGIYPVGGEWVAFMMKLECPFCYLARPDIKRTPRGVEIELHCPRCKKVGYAAYRRGRWHLAQEKGLL